MVLNEGRTIEQLFHAYFKDKNSEAGELLFATLLRELLPLFLSRIEEKDSADDLLQTLATNLLRRFRNVDVDDNFKFIPYAILCAENLLKNYYRSNANRTRRQSSASIDEAFPEHYALKPAYGFFDETLVSPERVLIDKETSEETDARNKDLIFDLLAQFQIILTPQQYSALIPFLEGKSQAEIANLLGIKENAVKSRISRARKEIEKYLLLKYSDANLSLFLPSRKRKNEK